MQLLDETEEEVAGYCIREDPEDESNHCNATI